MPLSSGNARSLSLVTRQDIVARISALVSGMEVDILRGTHRLNGVAIIDLVEADLVILDLAIQSLQKTRAEIAGKLESGVDHV